MWRKLKYTVIARISSNSEDVEPIKEIIKIPMKTHKKKLKKWFTNVPPCDPDNKNVNGS